MAGTFVVETEVGSVPRVQGITNFSDTAAKSMPDEFGSRNAARCCKGSSVIRRAQWIREKGVLDVGEHEFLVLLLVVQSQYDSPRCVLRKVAV